LRIYRYTSVDLKSSGGEITSNAYSASVYGTYYRDAYYVDGIITFGGANYDIERVVDGSTQKGDPSGALFSFALAAGYDFYFDAFTISPFARINYSQNNLGSYTEDTINGDPGLALSYSSQKAKSFTSALGTQIAYAWSTSFGVIRPELLFEWVHEFENNPDTVTASFVGGDGLTTDPQFTSNPSSIDSDFFNLGGGIYAVFPRGFSLFIYYERTLAYEDLSSNYISGGVRKEF